MMLLHVPRPHAWPLVMGEREVLNLPRKMHLDRFVLINALDRWDPRVPRNELAFSPTGIIGLCRFDRVERGDDCQLHGVAAPWVGHLNRRST